jgi:hypothetical protein
MTKVNHLRYATHMLRMVGLLLLIPCEGKMMLRPALAAAGMLQVLSLFASPVEAQSLVAPIALPSGGTVSPLPNGFSGAAEFKWFDHTENFSFLDGPTGTLRDRVLQYPDVVTPAHPYGSGLYFDYEITLTSGDVAQFIAPGYGGLEVSVKECGIAGCGGSGSFGVSATSASRSANGDDITFTFAGGALVGGTRSANLQTLTNAVEFLDPYATLVNATGDTFSVPVVAPAAVPEPSTWAMLLLGFAGLGFARRWRTKRLEMAQSSTLL